MNIAMTTLSSKILSQDKEHFAKLAVDAVMRLKVNCDSPTDTDFSFGGFSEQWLHCTVAKFSPLDHLWKNSTP